MILVHRRRVLRPLNPSHSGLMVANSELPDSDDLEVQPEDSVSQHSAPVGASKRFRAPNKRAVLDGHKLAAHTASQGFANMLSQDKAVLKSGGLMDIM